MMPTYSKAGNVVTIHVPFQDDIILNEESVKIGIENIKHNRSHYATEAAYQSHLKMYQDALDYLIAKGE